MTFNPGWGLVQQKQPGSGGPFNGADGQGEAAGARPGALGQQGGPGQEKTHGQEPGRV